MLFMPQKKAPEGAFLYRKIYIYLHVERNLADFPLHGSDSNSASSGLEALG